MMRSCLANAIASIRILKQQSSPLTEQERGILLSFPGGGILKECGVFTDADKPQWLVEGREELRSLLTDEEWEGIQNSGMQNSHYTLPQIRQAMWEALLPLIEDPCVLRVLDPGCGTAGFLWDMPNDDRLTYYGIDKDVLPVAIARKAIGKSKHQLVKQDFLQHDPMFPYGAAIGNVPFVNGVNSMVLEGKKLGIAIHAQFFIKSVQLLAPGAPLMFLTSTTTLDARGEDYVWFRRWLHRKCEFIGALRLPADAVHHGGTQVTTDLIILRRRKGKDCNEPDTNWIEVVESDLINPHYNIPVLYNQWFIDNPWCLLGDRTISKVRGKNGNPTNCLAIQSRPNFAKELRESLAKLTHQNNVSKENHIMATLIPADKFQSYSVFSFILRENPKQQGVEIHFPPEYVAESDAEKTLLEQIKSQGFVAAKSNPSLFYIKPRTTEEHAQLMAYMRKKVAACSKWGACELDADTPVEEIKPRRRRGGNKENKPVEPVATPTSAPIVDAIAQRLQPMLDELASKIQVPAADPAKIQELEAKCTEYLRIWQKDQESFKSLKSELDVFVSLNEDLKKDNKDLRSQLEKLQQLKDSNLSLAESLKKSAEECRNLENSLQETVYENEKLKAQLAEFGVGVTQQPEPDLSDDEPDLQDEPDLSDDEPDLQDEPDLSDDEDLPSAFQPQSSDDDDEDEGGFNIALLGE